MALTIELKPELELKLRQEAQRAGLEAGELIARAIEETLHRAESQRATASELPHAEAALLERINDGLPEKTWQEYHRLVRERRKGNLTPEDQERLVALSDAIEMANAERLAYVERLARLRNVSLPELMSQLGIKPRAA
jgi:hypothetical protein